MEKYLLFAYMDFYPCGGMEDCVFVANSMEELDLFVPKYLEKYGWGTDNMHYYDCQSGKIYVAEFNDESHNKQFSKWVLKSE